jgi:hypothetical protein
MGGKPNSEGVGTGFLLIFPPKRRQTAAKLRISSFYLFQFPCLHGRLIRRTKFTDLCRHEGLSTIILYSTIDQSTLHGDSIL